MRRNISTFTYKVILYYKFFISIFANYAIIGVEILPALTYLHVRYVILQQSPSTARESVCWVFLRIRFWEIISTTKPLHRYLMRCDDVYVENVFFFTFRTWMAMGNRAHVRCYYVFYQIHVTLSKVTHPMTNTRSKY